MGLLGAIVLATVAIIILSTLRTWLHFEFVALSLLVFKTNRVGKWLYTLIFLPGTILHELSHWLMAELLGVRTGEITVLPDFDSPAAGGSERLGSVATASSGPVRSFLIGAAPFTWLSILWILGSLLQSGDWLLWQYGLIFYGIVVVGSSMLLSKEDRRSWPFIVILVAILLISYYFLPLTIPITFITAATNLLSRLNQVLFVTVGAVLVIIGISYALRRIIEKILGKKVIRR